MLINQAFAADAPAAPPSAPLSGGAGTSVPAGADLGPSASEAFMWNMGMVAILVVLFYFLLILPQQRRFKEHSKMLSALKKGDKVVTGGGLIGVIDKIGEGDEAVVDLGNGVKVTVLRSSIQAKDNPLLRKKAANDMKEGKK